MTQIYDNLSHLPKVPTVPSSNTLSIKPETSAFDTDWSSYSSTNSSFHGQALLDFAQHGPQAYRPREPLHPPIADIRRKQLMRCTRLTDEEYNARASNLFRDFLGCPGFLNYRTRRKKRKEDSVWPDYLEFAFFTALVRYPPCGRTQFSHPDINGGKKMGRNELIGHYIKVTTGVERHRKQVSSHLQVIRPYVVDKPALLGSLISQKDLPSWNKAQQLKGRPIGVLTNQRISSHVEPIVGSLADFGTQMHGLTFEDNRSEGLALCDFQMSLCPETNPTALLHTYTCTNADSRLPDVKIENYRTAYELFPELFQNRFPRPIGSSILAIEASFSLPRLLKTPSGTELVIYLHLIGPSLPHPAVVETTTTFCLGPHVSEFNRSFEGKLVPHPSCPPGSSVYQIPFHSKHWATHLSRLGQIHSRSLDPSRPPTQAAQMRKKIDTELRSLTALQQVTISSPQARDVKHNVTLRWQFRLSANNATGAPGTLNWRQVGIPPILTELPSPSEEGGAGSFSSGEGRGSEPATPPAGGEVMVAAGGGAGAGALRSPIALRGEGWGDVGKQEVAGYEPFDAMGEGGMDMAYLPEVDLGMVGVEEGTFDFADFGCGMGSGTVQQGVVVDPSLVGEGWDVVSSGVGLGLAMESGAQQRQYGWMTEMGEAGEGMSG
ncbi:TEA/ATTS domain family-domain-containing protein [Elsinoe ampelina]|uniref:TEA/ATTS domain family-domain-containing protein n=1 Tax=Elsinoe ampelina TaxID=302913 RepID=A0A6A6G0B3_9PEZI|nr:TEA/ATTS domain family-domain-containing protein [Elsinoe ampelina]